MKRAFDMSGSVAYRIKPSNDFSGIRKAIAKDGQATGRDVRRAVESFKKR